MCVFLHSLKTMPHRLMAGHRFLVPLVEVRILVGQLNEKLFQPEGLFLWGVLTWVRRERLRLRF